MIVAWFVMLVAVVVALWTIEGLRRDVRYLRGRVLVLDDERARTRIEVLNLRNAIRRHELIHHAPPEEGGNSRAQLAQFSRARPPRSDIDPRQYLPDVPG